MFTGLDPSEFNNSLPTAGSDIQSRGVVGADAASRRISGHLVELGELRGGGHGHHKV